MQTKRWRLPVKPWDCLRPSKPLLPPFYSGVYSDSQLVSSILMGRSFFTLHLEDAISVCPFYSSRADIVPSRWVNPTWAGEALDLHIVCSAISACAPAGFWRFGYFDFRNIHGCGISQPALPSKRLRFRYLSLANAYIQNAPFRA